MMIILVWVNITVGLGNSDLVILELESHGKRLSIQKCIIYFAASTVALRRVVLEEEVMAVFKAASVEGEGSMVALAEGRERTRGDWLSETVVL
jgi:hypothetical protein